MSATALALVVGAVLLGLVAAWRAPEKTKRWYERFVAARNVVYGLIIISMMIVLLQTGSLALMLTGAFIALVIVVGIAVDGPLADYL
ncbi:hypothetical protein C2R22_24540 (plasmid) [Salinigranum rubrum]|uniref:Uncharacterized protein n=1 Tax=Salinigranum rubrum TaxID=755307 RepID=A0A2I8VRZ5_9EURY|nr:hypothetical protein [Salinigranum rubrum]AUV84700.1 hypothetical protein C2R22_24540 [Salinigranum rubrum]